MNMEKGRNDENTTMSTAGKCLNVEKCELDGRLSRLLRVKEAVAINSVHHVRIYAAYEPEEHVTVYILDVFLHTEQRGLPIVPASTTTTSSKQRQIREKCAEYQVEHHYSAFRALRSHISKTVAVPKDKSHPQWCPYCARVRRLVSSITFPFCYPNCRRIAAFTRLHELLVRIREKRQEIFMNQLLGAAKDLSYRSGCTPCDRFEVVSKFINEFLNGRQGVTKEE